MARGSSNTVAGYISGSALKPAAVNDSVALVSSADDDLLQELFALSPPGGASPTNVRVGFVPYNRGPAVGVNGARGVRVQPMRVMRSSTSTATPRAVLSGTVAAATSKTLPTAPSAGNWGIELLYAQLTYVDSSNPTKGTQVTLNWAPAPTYVAFASAANFATLPSNTSTSWNIPLKYVKNVAGVSVITQEDVFDVEPDGSFAGNMRHKLASKLGGRAFRRVYTSAQHSPKNMGIGGSSAFTSPGGSNQVLTSTKTPACMWRNDAEIEDFEILIDESITGGTSDAVADVLIDDSIDWRKANFQSTWNVKQAASGTALFGEDSTTSSTATERMFPNSGFGDNPVYLCFGQSHELYGGVEVYFQLGGVNALSVAANGVAVPDWIAGTDQIMLLVDNTGRLVFRRKKSGTGVGGPVQIRLEAVWPNGR